MPVECPHCYTTVMPSPAGVCPACRGDTRKPGADPDTTALRVAQGEDLPPICCVCGGPADRKTAVTRSTKGDRSDDLPLLLKIAVGLFSWPLGLYLMIRGVDRSSVVQVRMPQCDNCATLGAPVTRYVDFRNATMTLLVHRKLKEAVKQSELSMRSPK